MATIKLKRGTSTPTTSNIVDGEVALDLTAKKLYVNDGGTIKEIGAGALNASQLNDINVVAGKVAHGTDLGSIGDSLTTNSGYSDINTVANNISSVTAVASDISKVVTAANDLNEATSEIEVCANNISNINTVGNSISSVNNFANQYKVLASAPSSPSEGDLWYNSTANLLNYYTGSSWIGITGSTGITSLAADSSPELAAALDCNNYNLTEVGTDSGNNLQMDFGSI